MNNESTKGVMYVDTSTIGIDTSTNRQLDFNDMRL